MALIFVLSAVACDGGDTIAPEAESSFESVIPSDAEIFGDISDTVLHESVSIAVVGDSIARGYGLEDVENQRFSALLKDALHASFERVTVSNQGVDGMTGAELADMLSRSELPVLSSCDYVLVSIGGNNILRNLTEIPDASSLLSGVSPEVLMDYFKYLIPSGNENRDRYEYAVEEMERFFNAVNTAFSSEAFSDLVEAAGARLRAEIPVIVSELRKKNPDVKIIFQTVYNPYHELNLKLGYIEPPLPLHTYGERAVSSLNSVILDLSTELGYAIAPVYEEFDGSSITLTNAGFDLGGAFFSVDPHPNADGHALIAKIYQRIIEEDIDV